MSGDKEEILNQDQLALTNSLHCKQPEKIQE